MVDAAQPAPKRRGGARSGAGRKKGVVSARRMQRRIVLRLRDDEADALSAAAVEAGMKATRLLRSLVYERLRGGRAIFDVRERKLIAEMLHELRRQGSNLNQIAFALNCHIAGVERSAGVTWPEDRSIALAVDEARRMIERLRDLLAVDHRA